MPPKRPTKAIPIINPDSSQPPRPPPLPPTKPVSTGPRINSAYQSLKPTLENIDPAKIPITFADIEGFARADPLDHILTRLFLPYKCDHTTFEERFAAFHAAITPLEWDLTFKWKICLEINAHTLKTLHATQGADAVVSLAMKRWVQRILGHTLEETWAFAAGYISGRQPHPLGVSAIYGGDPMAPPVYHFSEQQQSSIYGGFLPYGAYHNRGNMYNPQRAPLSQGPQLRGPQFQGPYSHGILIPRPVPSLLGHKPHHAISLPNPPPALPNPGNKLTPSQNFATTQMRYLPHRPSSLVATLPSPPVPNPSGRTTPPHKRSLNKEKRPSAAEKPETENTDRGPGSAVSSWTKTGQSFVPWLIMEKLTKRKKQGVREGQKITAANQHEQKLPHSSPLFPGPNGTHHLGQALQRDREGSFSAATQPHDRAEPVADRVDKRKGKQKKVTEIQKYQITSNGESPTGPQSKVHVNSIVAITGKGKGNAVGSSMSTTVQPPSSQSSGRLVVKTLPNGKKQVVEQILQATNAESSSTLCNSPTPSRRKVKTTAPNPQATNPENKHHILGQEVPQATTQENHVEELIANTQMISNNEKRLIKVEGTNQLPARPAQTKGLLGVSITPEGNWVRAKQEKCPVLDNGEGGSNGFNGPQFPLLAADPVMEGKLSAGRNQIPKGRSLPTSDSVLPGFVNSKTLVVARIAYPKPLTSAVIPTPTPYTNAGQPPPPPPPPPQSMVLSAMPKKPDCTRVVASASGKTNAPEVILTNFLALTPDIPPPSLPDYAKAASGPNRKNINQKLHIPPTSPSRDPPITPAAPTSMATAPTTPPPRPRPPTLTKGLPSGQTPPNPKSRKSWSSIVTGNAANPNINKSLQRNSIEIEGFPELGKPLTIVSPNQLARVPHDIWDKSGLNRKASLSAMAEPFEPAEMRHSASTDPHLKNNHLSPPNSYVDIPLRPVVPPVVQFPTHAPLVTPIEHMSFPFDHLLGIFYDTPEFTKYLNKSYNELLFKENYLRAQYQRISETFVEEWDYITAEQRKAIIAKALSNLSERLDRVQFGVGTGVEKLMRDLGLTKYSLPTTPLLHKPMIPSLREAYLQGAPAHEETKGSSKSVKETYLKWRAEYCFDGDPDPLCISPDWLYSIISRLLGMPHTLRHRFGSVWHKRSSDSSVTSDHEDYDTDERLELWCPNDCLDCKEAEYKGWPTEWTFVRNNRNHTNDSPHPSSGSSSPRKNLPKDSLFETPSSQTPEDMERPFIFSQLSFLKKARLMSNRFTDPIFARSDRWKSANPGRAKFMELMNIDIALFYCGLIEEILQIFGEVRRERIWITLPSITDYYEGLPIVPTQQIRGRPRKRCLGKGSSKIRTSITSDSLDQIQRKKKREDMHTHVLGERKRMWEFVNEVQRTMDWKIAGLRLVDRDTDREVERAYDGGLWTVPVPPQERGMLEREFAKLRVWKG